MNVANEHINMEEFFNEEKKGKTSLHIKWNQAIVADCSHVFSIDLGSCSSVVLCGIDVNNTLWLGINHLFKCKNNDRDMSLEHISSLYNELQDKKVTSIKCIGIFGAGYSENSLAKKVAKENVINILEALHIFKLNIEIFQTGYMQGLSIIRSKSRNSIIIKQFNLMKKKKQFYEISLNDL